jgi:hypothetical protein
MDNIVEIQGGESKLNNLNELVDAFDQYLQP